MADRYTNYDNLLKKWHDLGLDEISKIHKVNTFNHFIKTLPTADVVEVVRCKDCKWWYNEIDCRNTNGLYRFVPNGNWFCASGERRDT